jgi:hypothetical protein
MWRLLEPKKDAVIIPKYTTLSYCWGVGNFMKLKSATYGRFRSWTPTTTLPQVFQDAMAVTRQMHVRYIWIDALCIVQDSEQDFHRQCTQMSRIYSNTTCNIAAATGDHPDVSLSAQRVERKIQVGKFLNCWKSPNSNTKYMESLDSIFDRDYVKETRDAKLFHRGWILQELLLSPRTLYFSPQQVYWTCCKFEACDLWPDGNPSFARGLVRGCDREVWSEIVEKYSRLSLSHTQDKLVALSGLAKSYAASEEDEYFAGHLKQQLPISLNWAPRPYHRKAVQSPKYTAPSWSWASVEGDIYSEFPVDLSSILCFVRSVSVTPAGVDPMGQLVGGQMVLEAPSLSVSPSAHGDIIIPELQSNGSIEVRVFWSADYTIMAETPIDLALTYAHHVRWSHVMSSTQPWHWELEIKGILLALSHARSQNYKRIGTLSVISRYGSKETPPQDGLRVLGLQMNSETRELIATDKAQYRHFNII